MSLVGLLGRGSVLVAVATAVAASPAHAAEPVFERYAVPTVGGAEINVEVMRPAGAEDAPILLTYSPYNTLSESATPNLANDALGERFMAKGYARAVADVLGTRNSSGCWDYGGADEQQSGVDLVNFLAAQPWSNGKVGMIGGSYDGTTATMVAARGADVPGLAAIVPEAAISRWYGYAYGGGVRYFLNSDAPTDEGFDTPLAFDFGLARTPPTHPDDALFADKLASRANPCESAEHTAKGYDDTPDYGDFWLERDYLRHAPKVRAAALVVHGWHDYNVKVDEGIALYEALRGFKRLYAFQGTHEVPDGREGFDSLLERFLDHTLLGVDNGIESEPPVISEGSDGFRKEASWPPRAATAAKFALQPGAYTDSGLGAEERALRDPEAQTDWLLSKTKPMAAGRRLAGTAKLQVRVTVDRETDLTPVLVDIAPDGTATTVSRGFLDLRYRGGLAAAKPVPVGRPISAVVRFQPSDWTFRAGHRIGAPRRSARRAVARVEDPVRVEQHAVVRREWNGRARDLEHRPRARAAGRPGPGRAGGPSSSAAAADGRRSPTPASHPRAMDDAHRRDVVDRRPRTIDQRRVASRSSRAGSSSNGAR